MPNTDREWLTLLVLALLCFCVAGSNSVMGLFLFGPVAVLCALALPILLVPRGLVAWVLDFVTALGLVGGLLTVTLFLHPLLLDSRRGNPLTFEWELLGYALLAMIVSAGAQAGILLIRAPERRADALRVGVLTALAYPFTAVVYWVLVLNGLPISA